MICDKCEYKTECKANMESSGVPFVRIDECKAYKKAEEEAYAEARREAMRLDDNEDTYKFRGYC